MLPLSALNHYLYCPRRAYLIHAEGVFVDNEHTILGDLAHEHVDFPGYEQRAGWTLLRALPLFSDTLGLSGKADLVEIRYANFVESKTSDGGRKQSDPMAGGSQSIAEARPVEYKKGPKRRWSNDEVQLCAQALCLEEMLGLTIPAGAIFHAQSQQRHEIHFDDSLRQQTLSALAGLRTLLAATAQSPASADSRKDIPQSEVRNPHSVPPPAELKPQCEGCSLHTVCLPEAAHRRAARLFEPRQYS